METIGLEENVHQKEQLMSLALRMDQKHVFSAYYLVQFIMHSSFIDFLCNDFLVNSKTVTLIKDLGVGYLPLPPFRNTLLLLSLPGVCVGVGGGDTQEAWREIHNGGEAIHTRRWS